MFGRVDARLAVDELLRSAAAGRAGVLAVEGEAGIGKTTLCDYAAESAVRSGFRVVGVRGMQWEAQFPLATLTQLLRSLASVHDVLPQRLRAVVDVVLGVRDADATPDLYSLAQATLWCVATASEARPVVIVVDDTHWIDDASAGVLSFALRRLEADAVAALLAGRLGGVSPKVWGAWPRMELGPLTAHEAGLLLGAARPDLGVPPPAVLTQLTSATAGNPLWLQELAASLDPSEWHGLAPLPDPLPLGARGRVTFASAWSELPERTRLALVLLAAAGSQTDVVERALVELGLSRKDFAPARDAAFITATRPPSFTHPLRRAAAYEAATEEMRARAHGVLAKVMPAALPQQRAWHLDLSRAPDDVVAEAMCAAAADVTRQAGAPAAGPVWQRSAELTVEPLLRDERTLAAASSLVIAANAPAAQRLVDDLLSRPTTIEVEATATLLWCQLAAWSRRGEVLHELPQVIERLIPFDPATACRVAILTSWLAANTGAISDAYSLADQACVLANGTTDELANMAAIHHAILTILARGAAHSPRLSELATVENAAGLQAAFAGLSFSPAHAALWQEDFELAHAFNERFIQDARRGQAATQLPRALRIRAEIAWWTGDWVRANAAASEGLGLAEQLGQPELLAYARAVKATMAASLGHREDAQRLAEAAVSDADERERAAAALYSSRALGLLELGSNNPAAAIAHLERAHALVIAAGLAQPTVVPYLGDLVEAHVQAGDQDRAVDLLADLRSAVERSGSRWAEAVHHRGLALVHPMTPAAEEHLRASVDQLEAAIPIPFELARSQLALGRLLRRTHRPAEARTALLAAAEGFRRLGAAAWLSIATAELPAPARAAFAADRPAAALTERLSPQQLQVCLQVAGGATNREAAATLFLSPKTVDYHLRRALSLLGIRTRVELARLIAEQQPYSAGVNPGQD